MDRENPGSSIIEFAELETRFGSDNAFSILRILEQLEGVPETRVAKLSRDERLRNVFIIMKENMRYQTQH